jgi:DNA-binding NarL/FixJ family response regulator
MQDLPENQMQGLFPKTLSTKAFLQGIYQVLAGEKFVPDQKALIALISSANDMPRKSPDFYHLTAREKEVIGFLAKGATNKDIARALDLQIVTVKLHVRGICRKLEAKNRTQAALIAIENGWDV